LAFSWHGRFAPATQRQIQQRLLHLPLIHCDNFWNAGFFFKGLVIAALLNKKNWIAEKNFANLHKLKLNFMLVPLDNETIFKKVFTDHEVFHQFVKDLFDVDIVVSKIETEKKFAPLIANMVTEHNRSIDIKLDIYAETDDHRFVIEIQRIDYDYNFNRFLNYFISLLTEQQRKGEKYEIPQTVLGVVVLTRPYKIHPITREPTRENVMAIDFDPRNFGERIKLLKYKLLFMNPNPKYRKATTPKNYRDWLDLFSFSIDKNINIVLNLNNKGIAKATKLAEYENLDPTTLEAMKIAEAKKAMISLIENEGRIEGINEGMVIAAKNGIKAGLSNDTIKIMTGLQDEQIDELRKNITCE